MFTDGGAGSIVRVQVGSLQQYASQLQNQIEAMSRNTARLTGNPNWGRFGQAYDLDNAHKQTLGKMKDLLNQVTDGVGIAQKAATTIGAAYSGADEFHRARLSEVNNALGAASGVPASTGSAGPGVQAPGIHVQTTTTQTG